MAQTKKQKQNFFKLEYGYLREVLGLDDEELKKAEEWYKKQLGNENFTIEDKEN